MVSGSFDGERYQAEPVPDSESDKDCPDSGFLHGLPLLSCDDTKTERQCDSSVRSKTIELVEGLFGCWVCKGGS